MRSATVISLAVLGLVFLLSTAALAASIISYQGQLQWEGQPYDGQADMSFQLFDQSSGGEAISGLLLIDSVSIQGGLFQVELDFGPDVFGNRRHYLEIHVGGQLLSPRQVIHSVPVAHYALSSRQIDADSQFQVRCQGGGRLIGMREDALPLCSLRPAVHIGKGSFHACAVQDDGEVWCWGRNTYGELGDGTSGTPSGFGAVQVRIDDSGSDGGPLTGALRVAGGGDFASTGHSCAIDDQGAAWCWGSGYTAGDGDQGPNRLRAVRVINQSGSPVSDAIDIAAGRDHSCLLRANGTVLCWGRGSSGQLGNGGTELLTRATPVRRGDNDLELTNIAAIDAGYEHSCAIESSGQLWCWGRNETGQLGTGSTSSGELRAMRAMADSDTPLDDVIAIGLSIRSSCAVRAVNGGEVWCWGARQDGALGDGQDGSAGTALYPVRVIKDDEGADGEPMRGAIKVTGAQTPSDPGKCAARDDGTLWCWGAGFDGQLGNDGTSSTTRAVQVVRDLNGRNGGPLRGVVQAARGDRSSCALGDDGSIWCWGNNRYTGVGGLTPANAPTPRAMEVTRRIEREEGG